MPQHTCHGINNFSEGKQKVSSRIGNVLGTIWDLFGSSRMPKIIVLQTKIVFVDPFRSCPACILINQSGSFFIQKAILLMKVSLCASDEKNAFLKENKFVFLKTDWKRHANINECSGGLGSKCFYF